MTNRVREFNNIREKRLSQSNSQISFSSRTSQYLPFSTKLTQRKNDKKEPICLDCVNHKLITYKKQRIQKDKQQKLSTEQQFQKIKINQEKYQEMRNKMMNQASLFNHKAIQQIKRKNQFQKRQDQNLMKSTCDLQLEQIKNETKLQQQHREKIEKYRRQLEQQYKQQSIRKDLMKKQKFATQPNECIIQEHDSAQILKQYGKQLKKQIISNKIRSQQLKKMQHQIDQKNMNSYEKDFFKYTEFNQSNPKKSQNPQIFEEMKQRQLQKQLQKIDQRQRKLQERKQELIQAKKQAELKAQKSLKSIKSYASILEKQIASKKKEEEFLKKIQKEKFLQQIKEEKIQQEPSKRPCGQCCKSVKEMALSYY